MRRIVRQVTPPILLNAFGVAFSGKRQMKRGSLKDSAWYDAVYRERKGYTAHYCESPYYFMWTVIGDRMQRLGVQRILDLGCGPGQFATFLRDRGVTHYTGLDFSGEAVAMARQVCPEFRFVKGNVHESDLLEKAEYDCVVSLEFLEHVPEDLPVLRRVREGSRMFGSVPNYDSAGHVRVFRHSEDVSRRYAGYFRDFSVDYLLLSKTGAGFYLFEGLRTPGSGSGGQTAAMQS